MLMSKSKNNPTKILCMKYDTPGVKGLPIYTLKFTECLPKHFYPTFPDIHMLMDTLWQL